MNQASDERYRLNFERRRLAPNWTVIACAVLAAGVFAAGVYDAAARLFAVAGY
ncbi:MAG: hypothetical protein J0H41_18300 [Rhizobiales bacterium]|nr:hypothetical protein [Hyphomicrobiales bacterium]